MKIGHIKYLACPSCSGELVVTKIEKLEKDSIECGEIQGAFFCLPKYLKPGGSLVIDVYRYNWWRHLINTRYWVWPITRHISPERLYKWCVEYVNLMWPFARWINKLPFGSYINHSLLIADYRGFYPLSEEMLKEWALLDTFDGLSPIYAKPQPLRAVAEWFERAQLENVSVGYREHVIVGRGTRCGVKK